MSATPRTDAQMAGSAYQSDYRYISVEFARQLESELQEAQKENERIKSLEGYRAMGKQIADALDERDQLRQQISELETRHAATMLHTQSVVDENTKLRQQLTEARAAVVVMREALKVTAIKCFNIGKLHGHEDTVEACFIPVMPQDLSTYDAELVEEMLCDGSLPEAKQALQLNCGKELLEVVKLQHKIIEAIDEDDTCLGIHELRRDMKQALTKTKEIGL